MRSKYADEIARYLHRYFPEMKVILLTLVILGVAMAGFLIRLFFVKDAEVRGGCASKNPLLAAEMGKCPTCGALPTEECASDMPKIQA